MLFKVDTIRNIHRLSFMLPEITLKIGRQKYGFFLIRQRKQTYFFVICCGKFRFLCAITGKMSLDLLPVLNMLLHKYTSVFMLITWTWYSLGIALVRRR